MQETARFIKGFGLRVKVAGFGFTGAFLRAVDRLLGGWLQILFTAGLVLYLAPQSQRSGVKWRVD